MLAPTKPFAKKTCWAASSIAALLRTPRVEPSELSDAAEEDISEIVLDGSVLVVLGYGTV